jgi:hypothetical protein
MGPLGHANSQSSIRNPLSPIYFSVCTSTDNTLGKSLAIGAQLFPPSGEQ